MNRVIESDFSILKVWFVVPGFFLFNTDHNFISSFLVGKKQFLEKTLAREMSNFVSNFVLPAGLWWEPGEVHLGGWGGMSKYVYFQFLWLIIINFQKFSPAIDGYTDFEKGSWTTCCMVVSRGEQKSMQNLLLYCYA